jgi:hypothetical protein
MSSGAAKIFQRGGTFHHPFASQSLPYPGRETTHHLVRRVPDQPPLSPYPFLPSFAALLRAVLFIRTLEGSGHFFAALQALSLLRPEEAPSERLSLFVPIPLSLDLDSHFASRGARFPESVHGSEHPPTHHALSAIQHFLRRGRLPPLLPFLLPTMYRTVFGAVGIDLSLHSRQLLEAVGAVEHLQFSHLWRRAKRLSMLTTTRPGTILRSPFGGHLRSTLNTVSERFFIKQPLGTPFLNLLLNRRPYRALLPPSPQQRAYLVIDNGGVPAPFWARGETFLVKVTNSWQFSHSIFIPHISIFYSRNL